ncbi:MAG: TlpA disulfide reductase family protein [Pseudomonadota bacterium]
MLRPLTIFLTALALSALAQAAPPKTSGEAAATGYYRTGDVAPETADLSRGDVPRDSYGRPYTYEGLGEALPAFSGELASGASFSTSLLEGRWTVIEVWGIWCHDSRNDAPYAAALSRALAQDAGVDFMSIHTPPNSEHADKAYRGYDSVPAWFAEKGWSFPTVIDADASIRETLRIRWTPTYLVIAPDLSVQGFRTGLADAGELAVKDFVQDIAETRADWQPS